MNERIRALRLALGLSQEEFGRHLGVGRGAITNIEFNKVEPKPLFVNLICREFNVNEAWLRTGEGDMFLDLPPDKELDDIFAQIKMSDDNTIKAIIRAYWKLPDEHKAVIRQLINDIAEQQKNGQG